MYIKVNVKAGAKEEKIEKITENSFKISVREKAERNMANNRVLNIISIYFKEKKVRIINGHHSPSKLLSVGE